MEDWIYVAGCGLVRGHRGERGSQGLEGMWLVSDRG